MRYLAEESADRGDCSDGDFGARGQLAGEFFRVLICRVRSQWSF